MPSPFVYIHWHRLVTVAGLVGCLSLAILFDLQSAFYGSYKSLLEEKSSHMIELELNPDKHLTPEESAHRFNLPYHETLRACQSSSVGCGNKGKLVILAMNSCKSGLIGATNGEAIWCSSFLHALYELGYSMLIPNNRDELFAFWREYREHVQLIVWNSGEGKGCQDLSANNTCVQSNPYVPLAPPNATHLNIPLWKIFNMHFWNGPAHPYGAPFTLSPEDYSTWPHLASGRDNFFLGYSVERTCLKVPYVPHFSRPRQVYVYAKSLAYLTNIKYILRNSTDGSDDDEKERSAKSDFYYNLSKDANMTFVAKMNHDVPGLDGPPHGIVELPSIRNRTVFLDTVAHSRVVMGVGKPALSPTPWEALCLGVPFINVITHWNKDHPDDKSRWVAQQDSIFFSGMDEPFVYNVKAGDRVGLEVAIRKALEKPIERFVPRQMTMTALIERTRRLVETDWRPVATQQLLTIAREL